MPSRLARSGSMAVMQARLAPHALQLRARLKILLDSYVRRRQPIQKGLTVLFVLYCLTSTYSSLTGKGAKGGAREKRRKNERGGFVVRRPTAARGGDHLVKDLTADSNSDRTHSRTSVNDPLFYQRLKRLLRIVVPSLRSREGGMLILHSAFLCARTGLSLYVADLDGR